VFQTTVKSVFSGQATTGSDACRLFGAPIHALTPTLFQLSFKNENRSPKRNKIYPKRAKFPVELAEFNTELSEFNIELSEFNIELSEFNTELSEFNTELSEFNTELSEFNIELSEFNIELSEFNIEFGDFKHLNSRRNRTNGVPTAPIPEKQAKSNKSRFQSLLKKK
jgi:chromosome segregation ATPase